jgi:acetolactate synthase-1/2/3 large subunit
VLASIDTTHSPASSQPEQGIPHPSTEHIAAVARLLAGAENPVIVTSNLGRNVAAIEALGALTEKYAIPVAEAGATCVNLPASHAMHTGQAGSTLLRDADLIIVVDCEVPWFPRHFSPQAGTKIVHLGIDPLFTRYPIRSFPANLIVPGCSHAALRQLSEALEDEQVDARAVDARRRYMADFRADLAARRADTLAAARQATPIRYDHLGACIRESLPSNGLVITELGVKPDQLNLDKPGSLIGVGIGGGLGFGLGASLGAKLAAPEKLVVSTVGDGSYMFGNPTPFHFVSRAANLPTLTIICNNERWHAVDASTRVVYPDGEAAAADVMPLVELKPSPEFTKVAEASDAFARRVDEPGELRGAIEAALDAVSGGRQALLDVRMEHGQR